MAWQRPSPRFWTARQATLAAVGLPAAVAVWAVLGLSGRGAAGPAAFAGTLALAAGLWLVLRGRYLSWGYVERTDDLVVRRGVLFRQTTVVPYGRMQFIDVSAGPVDRLFGLATVQLHTAAAAADPRIPGLLRSDADRLRDRLAAAGEARTTGL